MEEIILVKCLYLFYKIKENPASGTEAGYRIEISHEEPKGEFDLCGLGRQFGIINGPVHLGKNN